MSAEILRRSIDSLIRKILQEKARQSVAPTEELNNLRSLPGDMGSLEACETNVVENCVDQKQMMDPKKCWKVSNVKKNLKQKSLTCKNGKS